MHNLRRTIGDILNNEDALYYRIFDHKYHKCRIKSSKYGKTDEAPITWVGHLVDNNFIPTEDLLRIKAVEFGKKLGCMEWGPLNGEEYRFKKKIMHF